MNVAKPIKSKKEREAIKAALGNPRDKPPFTIAINSALRIGDILKLTVGDVRGKEYLTLKETKNKKGKTFKLNRPIIEAVKKYVTRDAKDGDYLFQFREGSNKPITRQTAFNVFNAAAKRAGLNYTISPHSLRKTWAYMRYKEGVDMGRLMIALNHSSERVTLAYIGVQAEDMDEL